MRALVYIAAFFVGLFLRTAAAAIGGIDYTMDGHDIVLAFLAMLVVWEFRAFFMKKRKVEKRYGSGGSQGRIGDDRRL